MLPRAPAGRGKLPGQHALGLSHGLEIRLETLLTCVYFVLELESVLVYITVFDGDDVVEAVLLELDPVEARG